MLDKIKDRLRLETVLLGVVVVITAGGAYLYQLDTSAKDEVQALSDTKAIAVDDLGAMSTEAASTDQKLAEKEAELGKARKDAQAKDGPAQVLSPLSSKSDAWGLSSTLIAFAAERRLDLSNFDTIETTVQVGSTELPAVSYSIVATGEAAALLDLLRIVAGVETIRISTLDLERRVADVGENAAPAVGGPTTWVMSLDLDVIYAAEG